MISLSVVIPTCNRNDLLGRCLDALKLSTQKLDFGTIEIVVSDDGKNNEARDFLAEDYQWVTWIEGPKKGPAANRNAGAKQTNAPWIAFLDDDCVPDQDWLGALLSVITSGKFTVIEGRTYCGDGVNSPLYCAPINEKGGMLWSCNFAIEKELFNHLGGFDEMFKFPNLEDNDLRKRILAQGIVVHFEPLASVNHPARLLASPSKIAMYHTSWIYFHKKHGIKKTFTNLLVTITRTRLANIRSFPLSKDSFVATRNLFMELYYTILYKIRLK